MYLYKKSSKHANLFIVPIFEHLVGVIPDMLVLIPPPPFF